MPPIFGIIHTGQGDPDSEILHNITRAAVYKVPRNIVTEDIQYGWFGASLIPNRDKQKVFYNQDGIDIVADACLYNRNSLIQKLEKDLPPDAGDARLILEAYVKWGSACVNFLYGDFAFVITNPLKGEIFCGRDPLGIRPLFYTLKKGLFIFASEMRLVRSTIDHLPGVNIIYFIDTLTTRVSEHDVTPFDEIKRLEPGHFFLTERGKRSVCQYWNPDPAAVIKLDSKQEYIDMFREVLLNAVQQRCGDTKNLGTELSGGLDSSAIAGIAADCAADGGIKFTAYSNVAPGGSGIKDESNFIDKMLEFKKIDSVKVDSLDGSLINSMRNAISLQGCFPQQVFSVFNNGLYKAASERGTEVLLSGFGGDEVVSAKVKVPWNELIDDGKFGIIMKEICNQGSFVKSVYKPVIILFKYILSKFRKKRYVNTGSYSRELMDKRFDTLPITPGYNAKYNLRSFLDKKYVRRWRRKLNEKQIDSIFQNHVNNRLESCYAAAAWYGLEYRYPLLDPNLILTCLAFPPWVKFHKGVSRYLFRQAIEGIVPEEIRLRNDKSGGTIPQAFSYLVNEKEQIASLIKIISEDKDLAKILDYEKMQKWYDDLVKKDPKETNRLMQGSFYRYLMVIDFMMGSYKTDDVI